jgi:toxin FitB
MILLDTNVLSELMRAQPSPQVTSWIARQLPSELFTTSITESEIFYGIELLASGKRRDALLAAAETMFGEDLRGRVLGFESEEARAFAAIAAHRRALGRPISHADGQIAAIAKIRRAILATHDVGDFEDCGLEVVDPWSAT